MNWIHANCGTSFTWVSDAVHPAASFIGGWASLAAGLAFMVSASLLAWLANPVFFRRPAQSYHPASGLA